MLLLTAKKDEEQRDKSDNVYDNRAGLVNGESSTSNGIEADPFDLGESRICSL